MKKFAYSSNSKHVFLVDEMPDVRDELTNGVYALRFDNKQGLYLDIIDDFSTPSELFGDVKAQADRVVNTFDARSGVTGMLLTGEKGSGKTMLGKLVALKLMRERNMPIIVVNIPVSGDDFGIFLQDIGKPVTLFFDEFEKVYDRAESQAGLLTILDGVYPLKLMAILTANDQSKMISPLLNRPGRVFYKINYSGLDYKFILEYATKKLLDQKHLPELRRLAALVDLNFDQLQALIEEMNRYGESVSEAVQMLNISTERPQFASLGIKELVVRGKVIPRERFQTFTYNGSLDFDEEEAEIYYRDENKLNLNFDQWYNQDDDRYSIMEKFSTELRPITSDPGARQKPLEFIPSVVNFGEGVKIDVKRSGAIVVSSDDGSRLVLEKYSKTMRKEF